MNCLLKFSTTSGSRKTTASGEWRRFRFPAIFGKREPEASEREESITPEGNVRLTPLFFVVFTVRRSMVLNDVLEVLTSI